MNTIPLVLDKQRRFFASNQTKELSSRIATLKKLRHVLKQNEQMLYDAIYEDLNKSDIETFLTEFSLIYLEIDYYVKHIGRFSKPSRVRTGLVNMPARSRILTEPYGNVLVIGTWNYPYHLSLLPALAALAAGNTVILKPSDLSPATARVMEHLVNTNFPESLFHVFTGDRTMVTALLEQRYDKIFYTGSKTVGTIVYEAAAKHLTPVTLELGGKSPTFVLKDADVRVAAKRIAWGKCLNAGQTCVAPDYLLVDAAIKEKFMQALFDDLKQYPQQSDVQVPHYMKIINEKAFDRLVSLIDSSKVCYGGVTDREKRFISPTVLDHVLWSDAVMQQEIFGPILPVITFYDVQQVIDSVKEHDRPLSCYVFSNSQKAITNIFRQVSFGGGCTNHVVLHVSNGYLPFGGVGASGIGHYHGKAGYECFTHQKSILHKPTHFEPSLIYPPYYEWKRKIIRWFVG